MFRFDLPLLVYFIILSKKESGFIVPINLYFEDSNSSKRMLERSGIVYSENWKVLQVKLR